VTPARLEQLARVVTGRSGLAITEARLPFLRARVRAAMVRAGAASEERWMEELEASASVGGRLWTEFEEALQVHETRFFRYAGHHRLLAEVVLPELAASLEPERTSGLRILSAGCATGEEPYSIAMTVLEHLPPGPGWPVEILGLDIADGALAAARRGLYRPSAVADVPRACLQRYFVSEPEGLRVARPVRDLVRFFRHDLRRDVYLGKFDIAFCCNVLLYFTPDVKQQVMDRLTAAIRRGGYLFLGHAEGITPPAPAFDARHHGAGVVYRRL